MTPPASTCSRGLRRTVAVLLIAAGAALLLLAPAVGPGRTAPGLGFALELIGLALERRNPR
jgi:hypothetical protein